MTPTEQMTTPPNAPEVDVLDVLDDVLSVKTGLLPDEHAALTGVRTAVAAMLTREAALVAERGALAAEVGALRGLLSDTAANLDRMAGDEFSDCDLVRLNYAVARINDNLARTTAARAEAGHG